MGMSIDKSVYQFSKAFKNKQGTDIASVPYFCSFAILIESPV